MLHFHSQLCVAACVGVSGCVVDIAGVHKKHSDPTVKNGTQQNKANLNMY